LRFHRAITTRLTASDSASALLLAAPLQHRAPLCHLFASAARFAVATPAHVSPRTRTWDRYSEPGLSHPHV